MKREQKYPNTRTFFYYNANPKNRITGDCTFRAIALAMDKPWEDVVMEMARMSCDTGYAINDKKGIERYLSMNGWVKHSQPRKLDNTKYTGKEFCKHLDKANGNVIATIGGTHVVCIKWTITGYKVHDIWNSTDGCIGNYWTKG